MLRTIKLARVWLGSMLVVVGGGAAACGQVLAEDDVVDPSDAAASDAPTVVTDAGTSDVTTQSPADPCSPPPGPRCSLATCTRRVLYANDEGGGAPWGIATDDEFVYWLEQPATSEGYNGHAAARVLRVSKDPGEPRAAAELAKDQSRATSLTVIGGWVYWASYEDESPPYAYLRRTRADCQGPCELESVAVPNQGVRIVKLVPSAPDALYALGEAGHVFRVDLRGPVMTIAGPLHEKGSYPSLVVTGQHFLVSSSTSETVSQLELGTDVVSNFISIPRRDGGDLGISNMWTDCTNVWARRGPTTELVRLSLLDAGFQTISDAGLALSPSDVAGDTKYVYFAGANEGLFALDRSTNALDRVGGLKAFGVATDAEGTYWGEHHIDHPSAGTIYMMVK